MMLPMLRQYGSFRNNCPDGKKWFPKDGIAILKNYALP
jgi:hypothetical protein